jgi:UDP-glucose 4-epimerase
VAGEGMISAMAEGGILDEAYIFRFVSILGERYTHGHVYDFYKQLVEHPDHLDVLGDGHQKKSYLYVGDCIRAMLIAVESGYAGCQKHRTAVLNLGTQEFVEVADSICGICDEMRVYPKLNFGDGPRGWVGDSPFIFLDTERMRCLGWRPSLSIGEALRKTVRWLRENEWVFEKRDGKPLQRPEQANLERSVVVTVNKIYRDGP